MTIHPLLGTGSTKGSIIEILSKKWPLTAKKIYFELTKNYSLPITYQAVHKTLKELNENKILEKTKEGYQINKSWIKDLGNFSEKLTAELTDSEQKREIKTLQRVTFNTHREFIKFHLDFMKEIIKKEKKLDMIFHYRHVPFPHVMSNEEIKIMKDLAPKIKWTILSKKDTVIGRWLVNQWKKMGVKVKLGVDTPSDRLMILNDYIFEVFTSKKAIEMWDKNYSAKKVENFDTSVVSEAIMDSKLKTIITIIKDKELASLLREYGK